MQRGWSSFKHRPHELDTSGAVVTIKKKNWTKAVEIGDIAKIKLLPRITRRKQTKSEDQGRCWLESLARVTDIDNPMDLQSLSVDLS